MSDRATKIGVQNVLGDDINSATEEKQDDIIENQTDGSQKTQLVDSLGGLVEDNTTSALKTITYEHHEIHAGNAFTCVDTVDLALNNVRDLQITTPDTTKWSHFVFNINVESETEWFLYENVTINTAGTTGLCSNANRNSETVATLGIKYIDNTSVANANADTAVAGATRIYHGTIGAGKEAGAYTHGHEIILKQNEEYSLRFIAKAAGYVNYHLDWYEHTDKN